MLLISTSNLAQQSNAPVEDIVELDRIVAIVNDDVLMESELISRLRKIRRDLLEKDIPPPPTDVLEKQVLERLILQRLQLQEAARSGIVVEDQTLNRTLQRVAESNALTLNQFRRVLERDGISFAQFREDVRNEILISRVRNTKVRSRVRVSDQEVEHLLANLENSGELDSQYRIGHILVAIPDGSSASTIQGYREKADRIIAELNNGADFRQTAATYSDAQTALEGGDLGWRKRNELPTAFADIIPAMSVGEIRGPVRTSGGFNIIKLIDTRGGKQVLITQTLVRHILIKPNEVVTEDEARSRVEHLRNRILSGENFEKLAKANSDDKGSAVKGGDLGWTLPGKLVPEFEAVMNKTRIGDVSAPFKSPFGWHILKVEDRRKYDGTKEIRRKKAHEIIHKRKTEEELELWLRRMREEAYVEIRLEQQG